MINVKCMTIGFCSKEFIQGERMMVQWFFFTGILFISIFFSHSQFWNNILLCLYIGCFQESCEPEILYIEFGKTKTKTKHWYIDTLLNDQMAKNNT